MALAANIAMFVIELAASASSGSAALVADAADFLSDAANYGLSLGALALGPPTNGLKVGGTLLN